MAQEPQCRFWVHIPDHTTPVSMPRRQSQAAGASSQTTQRHNHRSSELETRRARGLALFSRAVRILHQLVDSRSTRREWQRGTVSPTMLGAMETFEAMQLLHDSLSLCRSIRIATSSPRLHTTSACEALQGGGIWRQKRRLTRAPAALIKLIDAYACGRAPMALRGPI